MRISISFAISFAMLLGSLLLGSQSFAEASPGDDIIRKERVCHGMQALDELNNSTIAKLEQIQKEFPLTSLTAAPGRDGLMAEILSMEPDRKAQLKAMVCGWNSENRLRTALIQEVYQMDVKSIRMSESARSNAENIVAIPSSSVQRDKFCKGAFKKEENTNLPEDNRFTFKELVLAAILEDMRSRRDVAKALVDNSWAGFSEAYGIDRNSCP